MFADDGTVQKEVYNAKERSALDLLRTTVRSASMHQIKDFLERPVILTQSQWTASNTIGDVLWSADFPSTLLSTSWIQNLHKINGHVAMRGKVKVRVQVNSQPFQAGLAMLVYVPYGAYLPTHRDWYLKSEPLSAPVRADIWSASQLPHVILNLANETSVEYISPYISPYMYVNMVTGQGNFGTFALVNLRPILSGSGTTTVNYTVYANFEEVELLWPTDASLTTIWAQAGGELQTLEETGTISGAVDDLGASVSRFLPTIGLGGLSKPVEAFTTIGSGILRLFGFSKPSVQAPVTRVLESPARYMFNIDGADTSHKLGLSCANEIEQMTGFAGTDFDEMDISYVCSRAGLVGSGLWTTSNGADVQIYTQVLTPRVFGSIAAWDANKAFLDRPTTVAYIANMFNMWRGDMVFTFHFAKTMMHSGRLRISLRNYSYANTSATLNDQPGFCETATVDIATTSVVRFRVPFRAVRPWLFTAYERATPLATADGGNFCLGQLQVTVINALVAPAAVDPIVPFYVFGHMENASFAVPSAIDNIPVGLPAAQMNGDFVGIVPMKKTSQDNKQYPVDLLPYKACVGESITNLRQLLKRFTPILLNYTTTPVAAGATTPGASGNTLLINPWAPVAPLGNITISTTSPDFRVMDLYSMVYPLYAFYRGSMRIKIVFNEFSGSFDKEKPVLVTIATETSPSAAQQLLPVPDTTNLGVNPPVSLMYDTAATNTGSLIYQRELAGFTMPLYLSAERCIEFEVPYYSTGHMCATTYATHDQTARRTSRVPLPQVVVTHQDLKNSKIAVYRAIGDDFSFGCLLGAPKTAYFKYNANPTV